MAISRYICGN